MKKFGNYIIEIFWIQKSYQISKHLWIDLIWGLEYLLKIPNCIILDQIFVFVAVFFLSNRQHCPTSKNIIKVHLCLVIHIFTKLSNNACLINIHNLIYKHRVIRIFIHNWWSFKPEVLLHLHQTFTNVVSGCTLSFMLDCFVFYLLHND